LSILSELNNESIYLKLPDKYKGDISKLYNSQLKYLSKIEQSNSEETSMKQQPLNQILYGPPGTGKTYNTINKALEIIDGEVPEDRQESRERFKLLRESGKIEFVTFHQSYGYEEFVEGIKADLESDESRYVLEDGIFKKLSKKAEGKSLKLDELKFSDYVEVGNKFKTLNQGKEFEVIDVNETLRIKNSNDKDIPLTRDTILSYLKNKDFTNTRGHHSYEPSIAKYIFDNYDESKFEDNTNKNYILIIDEINRGNSSKIFGELITLIEPSKRIDEDEEIRLTLQNSKEPFGVPSNLYIIGTMNTADRSIAQIDTALRRRFEFVEMMPKADLLKDIVIDGIEIQNVLEAMNERIEYIYDREHTIGHSYFLPLIQASTIEKLDEIFRVNIIPLLAEYFYGDWGDIAFVLNNNFVKKKDAPTYIKSSSRQLNDVYEINEVFELEEYKNIYNA